MIFCEKTLDKKKILVYNMLRLAYANCMNDFERSGDAMTLKNAEAGREYEIKSIGTGDEELNSFLFSLGCYSGEAITVIRHRRGGCVVSIKDARYNIDNQLAEAIEVVA